MKMRIPIAARLSILFLLSPPPNSFAGGSVLMTPDFTVTGAKVTPTNKWVVLESFATVLECNDRRSSLIGLIDKERRELRDVEGTERELRLLWYIYTKSKCVSSS
jgi:hypothetical protein